MKKYKKCALGGSLAGDLGELAPLISMIPGVGSIAGPALSLIGGLFGDKQAKEPRNPMTSSPGNYYLGGPVLPLQESTAVKSRPYMGVGQIDPAVTNIANLDQLIQLNRAQAQKFLQAYSPSNTPTPQRRPSKVTDRFLERANGGFVELSNNSYSVEGNPDVTDSVATNYKGINLKLDDQEVIDTANNFVYSNKVINPLTGKSFAKDAERLERNKGKAEKAVTRYNDPHAQNTVKHMNSSLSSLAKNQELVALLKGKRSSATHMAYGGPTDPPNPWLPFLYSNNQGAGNAMQSQQPNWTYSLLDQMNPLAMQNQTLPSVDVTASRISRPSAVASRRRTLSSPVAPTVLTPTSQGQSFAPSLPNDTQGPLNYGDLISADPNANFSNTIGDAESYERGRIAPFLQGTPASPQISSAETTGVTSNSYTNDPRVDRGFTVGDALQVGSLVNSFARLRGGPEKEQANYDTSKITRNVYDVNTALQSNAANFNNTTNSIDTSSSNLRRALQNQMLASKMRSDNSALTQYDQLNQQARTDYEGRVSNQQRYNVGQRTYTNDINARNRGAYDSAVQNAFGNLSNFGIGLNQRKQGFDALDLYGSTYKDVYSRILKTLGQNG